MVLAIVIAIAALVIGMRYKAARNGRASQPGLLLRDGDHNPK
jgi:hypothetical protein